METKRWDLEEIPYETNDEAGGWYLHFDPTGETTDAVLYMSKAHVTEAQARLIAAAPDLLEAAKGLATTNQTERHAAYLRLQAAIARAEGRDSGGGR